MKRVLVLVMIASIVLMCAASAFAEEKPRLGVLRFTNNTSAAWWGGSTGNDLRDMLTNELRSTEVFTVLERGELGSVMAEQDLGASGRVEKSTKAKIGKIKGAQYLVSATVTSYQENTSGSGGGIGILGFSVGGAQSKAYMSVDLKVIDATTSEVVDSRSIEANSSSSALGLGASHGIFSGGLSQYSKTPAGKAIRACIIEISEYLKCSMVERNYSDCMTNYAAKENRRRENTKKAIDLE